MFTEEENSPKIKDGHVFLNLFKGDLEKKRKSEVRSLLRMENLFWAVKTRVDCEELQKFFMIMRN